MSSNGSATDCEEEDEATEMPGFEAEEEVILAEGELVFRDEEEVEEERRREKLALLVCGPRGGEAFATSKLSGTSQATPGDPFAPKDGTCRALYALGIRQQQI